MKNATLRRHIIESTIVAIVLTAVSYLVGLCLGWIHDVNWLEVAAVSTSYACTYLGVKQRRINYIYAVVTTALYCVLFFQAGLISSGLLQVYLIPTVIYGWFRWRKDSDPRPVQYAVSTPKWIPAYLGVTLAIYAGAYLVNTLLGGGFAPLDAFILAGTILAQFLMDNKKRENWIIWALVDVVALYEYFSTGLFIAALQYVFFLANTLYGWQQWKITRAPQPAAIPATQSVGIPNPVTEGE